MKRIAWLSAGILLIATTAAAGPNWHTISLTISLQDAPKVQTALDTLMNAVGDDLTGNVSLMANVAGGSSSHSIISVFDTRAEREAWLGKLRSSKAWSEYVRATAGMTTAGENTRMNLVKSWGEENTDADVFWEMHAFTTTDAAAFTAAIDALQASDAGKATGSQVHLSEVAAAGLAPATHVVAVGFKSEAHAEASSAALTESAAWATYLAASRKVATHKGAFMLRTISTWGETE